VALMAIGVAEDPMFPEPDTRVRVPEVIVLDAFPIVMVPVPVAVSDTEVVPVSVSDEPPVPNTMEPVPAVITNWYIAPELSYVPLELLGASVTVVAAELK
jgi:hypothetical protein